eukprot:6172472-Pleurochrysis_carterae.AAC.1
MQVTASCLVAIASSDSKYPWEIFTSELSSAAWLDTLAIALSPRVRIYLGKVQQKVKSCTPRRSMWHRWQETANQCARTSDTTGHHVKALIAS